MEAVLKKEVRYTYEDYCTWPYDERWELIDGVAYAKAAPSRWHQTVSKRIFRQLDEFLLGKPCEVFYAPFAVRLNADTDDDTVVEPDILVVCEESKLADSKGVVGAPDFIVEILSPSTVQLDKVTKLRLYQRAGVREYWIVDPDSKTVMVYTLHGDIGYVIRAYDEHTDAVPVGVLGSCTVKLAEVFEGL